MESTAITLAKAAPSVRFRALALALAQGDLRAAGAAAGRLLPMADAQAAASRSPRYLKSANAVNALLTGTSTPRAGVDFKADKFLKTPVNAGCYGPTVLYQGHPDWVAGNPPKDGTLPSGDVGSWTAVDTTTDWACAAAQLDARMDGVALRSNTSLMTLASLINVANTAGKSLPAVGATVDLKAREPGLLEWVAAQQLPLRVFSSAQLSDRPLTARPSDWVRTNIGLAGVCEPCALLASPRGSLLVPKFACAGVTVAVVSDPPPRPPVFLPS